MSHEERGVIFLAPDEEAWLVQRIAEADEAEKAGLLIPWEKVRKDRGFETAAAHVFERHGELLKKLAE